MKKPNILVLMTDQQRADCMSCAGHPLLKTPNMDRLAGEGMRFAQAATVSPLCMPARASFLNGLYPHNHGIWGNGGELPAEDETFFQMLQRGGYLTAHIGKAHYYPHVGVAHMREREGYMCSRGFEYVHETTGPYASFATGSYMTDEWEKKGLWEAYRQDYRERAARRWWSVVRPSPLPVEDFCDSYVGARAVEFVDGCRDERPMCLFVGFGGPHDPWDAPGEYAAMYDPAKTPPPIPMPPHNLALPDWARSKNDFKPYPQEVLDKVPEIRANYYGKISLIDLWFGRILDAFARRGWLEDLLVVFWSDHGEMLGDHGRINKSTFHESSVRIPLVLRWPARIIGNTVTNALAENIDIFPTLLEAAGCEPSKRCLGRSLWPVLSDPSLEPREYQLSEVHNGERHICIRSPKYKYAVDEAGRGYMLHDLERDPLEQKNLVGDAASASLEAAMREQLLVRLVEAQYCMT